MHRPTHRQRRVIAAAVALTAVAFTGCSSDKADSADKADSSSSDSGSSGSGSSDSSSSGRDATTTTANDPSGGDESATAAFCAAGETINSRTSTIGSPDQAVTVFTELDPTLDAMVANSPEQVADAAATFVSTARASVASGDFTPFEDGTIDALVKQFDAVCGKA